MPQSTPCSRKLLGLIAYQDRQMNALYNRTSREISLVLSKYKVKSKKNLWLGNAGAKKEIDLIMAGFASNMIGMIKGNMGNSWNMADDCNDKVVNKYLKGQKVSDEAKESMMYRNPNALNAFVNRRRVGLNLSNRVWNITKESKKQLEQLLGSGVMDGRSAQGMATDLRRFLKEPNKQFRRVRNEAGKLVLSNPAKDYHPGQGVYRSSYKNALRLARNEVNMSYRHNDHLRRQNMPFVTGITVHLSNSHPTYDICDELQGDYPKTFKFGGWHPNCICFTTAKLLSKKEFIDYQNTGKIDASKNVKGIPRSAKVYLKKNAKTLRGYKNPPYFLNDNFDFKNDNYVFNDRNLLINEAKAKGLDSEKLFMKNGDYTPERKKLHDSIVNRVLAGTLRKSSKKKYMLGGGPANGKSTLVKSGKLPHPKGILTVDSDAIKGMLPEYNTMLANGDTLGASFVHEESSMLAKRIIKTAQGRNQDFVLDGVNDGGIEKLLGKIKGYKKGGSRVRGDYVSLDTKLSHKLAKSRADKTGRLVPEKIVQHGNEEISRLVPQLLDRNALDELYLWDTNIEGKARLILKQIDGKLTVYDKKLYADFLKKTPPRVTKVAKKVVPKAKTVVKSKIKTKTIPPKSTFNPAKTIKDAEEFALKNNFAHKINYEGASLDFVNTLNKTLLEETKKKSIQFFEISFDATQTQIMGYFGNSIKLGQGSLVGNKKISDIFWRQKKNAIVKGDVKTYYNASSRIANDAIRDKKNLKALSNKVREGHIKHEINHAYDELVNAMSLGGFGPEHVRRAKKWVNAYKLEIRKSHRISGKWKPSEYVDKWVRQATAEKEWFAETKLLFDYNPDWIENPVLRKLMGEFDEIYNPISKSIAKKIAVEEAKLVKLMKLAEESAEEVQNLANLVAKANGGYTTPINLKSRTSILRKTWDDYGGDLSKVTDAVRTTIIVDEKKIDDILKLFNKNNMNPKLFNKNRTFTRLKRQTPDKFMGYSGSITNLKTSRGIIGEIQINTERMIFAKEKPGDAKRILGVKRWNEIRRESGLEGGLGHTYYEEHRLIKGNTPKEIKRRRELERLSEKYYSNFQ